MISQIKLAGKKVLVTGASGFIGHHLCRKLDAMGCEIHGISRTKRQDEANGMKWWQSDLMEPEALLRTMRSIKPDIVYHLSGFDTGSRESEVVLPTFHSILTSTVNLLASLEKIGCERILLAGSMEEPRSDETRFSSISAYAAAKWAGSIYGRMFHALYNLPVVMLQVFMVYGPRHLDVKKLIPSVTLSLLKNEIPKLTNGSRMIDWIYIDDVTDGLMAAAQAKKAVGETVEIGSGELITVRGIVSELVSLINPTSRLDYGAIADRPHEGVRVADTRKTYELIGWKSRISLREGLQQTVGWYKEQLIADRLQQSTIEFASPINGGEEAV
jgi:UDP-glucose 4-epimerase